MIVMRTLVVLISHLFLTAYLQSFVISTRVLSSINDVKNNALAGVGRPMNEKNLVSLMLNFASLIDETIKIITELYFNIE